MHLLMSGEGPSDIGGCSVTGGNKPGPMAIIIDQLVELYQGYEFSHIDNGCVSYVTETELKVHKLKTVKKGPSLPGKRKKKETGYFFEAARSLADKAKSLSAELGDIVIAVLFHDSDGAVSSSRGIWRDKHQSMINGFTVEGYENFSVPMMPKPKSEAWLICALKEHAYQHCDALEDMPGNDDSPNGLKKLQFKILGEEPNTIDINERLRSKEIDIEQIIMPSFEALKSSVKDAVENALKIKEV